MQVCTELMLRWNRCSSQGAVALLFTMVTICIDCTDSLLEISAPPSDNTERYSKWRVSFLIFIQQKITGSPIITAVCDVNTGVVLESIEREANLLAELLFPSPPLSNSHGRKNLKSQLVLHIAKHRHHSS